MKIQIATAAVGLRTALKYRKGWNKHSPTVKLLQSLMPNVQGGKKGYRLYLDFKQDHKHYTIPPAVRGAVRNAGFVITDYLAKKCVKAGDTEQKNVYNIGKVISKDPHAKAAFDNDPQLQNSRNTDLKIVISCHPYDIIGMSTGRDWDKQSCMRLDDGRVNRGDTGQYSYKMENDVAEGTLVAYAIRASDTNLQKPLARCLIKPFVSERDHDDEDDYGSDYAQDGEDDWEANASSDRPVLFRRETRIYGNNVPGFGAILNKFLRRLNQHVPSGYYALVRGLYDDGVGDTHHHNAEEKEEITMPDVRDDNRLAVAYIKEQLANKASVHHLLNPLDDHSVVLHDTEIEEIAHLLQNNQELKDEIAQRVKTDDNPGATLMKVSKALKVSVPDDPYVEQSSYKTLGRYAHMGHDKAMVHLLDRLEKSSEQQASASDRSKRDLAYHSFFTSHTPFPPHSMLAKYPHVCARFAEMAKAGLSMNSFFDQDKYDEFVYNFRAAKIDPTTYESSTMAPDAAMEFMHDMGSYELTLSYIHANHNRLGSTIFEVVNPDFARRFDNRKLYRAFKKLKGPLIEDFVDRMLVLVAQQILIGMRERYKDAGPDAIQYLIDNTEHINEMTREWDAKKFGNLLKMDVRLAMHITPQITNAYGQLVGLLADALCEWKGEPLMPETTDMELMASIAVYAARITDEPVDLQPKFDDEFELIERPEEMDRKFSQRAQSSRQYLMRSNLAAVLRLASVGGEQPNVLNDPEFIEYSLPLATSYIGGVAMAKHTPALLDRVREMSDVGEILKVLSNISHSFAGHDVDYTNPRDYADEKVSEFDSDDPRFDSKWEEFQEEGKRKLRDELELLKRMQYANSLVLEFLGEDAEDYDGAFGVDLPNVEDDDIQANAEQINELREEVISNSDTLNEEEEEHSDNL